MTIDLIKATSSDAEELNFLINHVYRGQNALNSWTSEAGFIEGQRTDVDMLKSIINSSDQYILVNSDKPIYCCCHVKIENDTAWLGMLTVSLDKQNLGLGKKLISAAERIIRETSSCSEIKMHVISIRQELIDWYQRQSFEKTTDVASFPYGNERFGKPLRSDLEFLVLKKTLV